jgi:hypothetical protein
VFVIKYGGFIKMSVNFTKFDFVKTLWKLHPEISLKFAKANLADVLWGGNDGNAFDLANALLDAEEIIRRHITDKRSIVALHAIVRSGIPVQRTEYDRLESFIRIVCFTAIDAEGLVANLMKDKEITGKIVWDCATAPLAVAIYLGR